MQGRVFWVWSRASGTGETNGRGWDLTASFSLLLLPPASLLEGQVDDGTIGHVVVSQRVGILDEDALENRQRALVQGNLALGTSYSLTTPNVCLQP